MSPHRQDGDTRHDLKATSGVGVSLVNGVNKGWTAVPGAFPITGGTRHGFHLRGFAGYSIGRAPIDVRAEFFFNRLNGGRSFRIVPSLQALPSAIHDDVLGGGLTIMAFTSRTGRFVPYLLGGVGIHHTRLGTNPDSFAESVSETRTGSALGAHGGVGFRLLREPLVALELRSYYTLGDFRGAYFAPLTVAIAF
jgi:hypothetical protein